MATLLTILYFIVTFIVSFWIGISAANRFEPDFPLGNLIVYLYTSCLSLVLFW